MSAPTIRPAWQVYLGAFVLLLPAFLAWSFSNVILEPAMEKIWHAGGIANSRTMPMFNFWEFFVGNGRLILVVVSVAILLLELFVPAWPRWRTGVMFLAVFLLNALVLLGLLDFCTLSEVAGLNATKSL